MEIGHLYEQYYDRMMIIACSYTHDRGKAEDLVHDAFLKAILSYREGGSFLYWASRVIRNTYLNEVKKESRTDVMPVDEMQLRAETDLLQDYIADEEKRRLAAMIALLPDPYKTILAESVYMDVPDDVLATDHGITTANVRQIRSRAKKMLMEMAEHTEE